MSNKGSSFLIITDPRSAPARVTVLAASLQWGSLLADELVVPPAAGRAQHPLFALLSALAFQDGLPIIRPGQEPPARCLQPDVPVVAAGEEDVLPARVQLCA